MRERDGKASDNKIMEQLILPMFTYYSGFTFW